MIGWIAKSIDVRDLRQVAHIMVFKDNEV